MNAGAPPMFLYFIQSGTLGLQNDPGHIQAGSFYS